MSDIGLLQDPLLADILRLSFHTSEDAIAVLLTDGTLRLLNESAVAAFGLSGPVPAEPTKWFELWDGDARVSAAAALARAAGGCKSELLSTCVADAGAVQTWNTTITPLLDADGATIRLLASSRNVTAERNAMRALEKSALVRQALIEATSEIVWHFDVASGVTDRQGWAAFTGVSDDPCDPDSWLDFLHPDDREAAEIATVSAMGEARPLLIEYRMRHRAGEWRWVEDHATPLLGPDGSVSDWVGIISDIHDRRVAEEALRASEQRLRFAVEATGLAIWEVDVATGRRFWSSELLAMMQVSPGAATRDTLLERVHPEDRKRVEQEFGAAVQAGRDVTACIHRLLLPSGDVRWVEGCLRSFRGVADKDIVRHIGTLQDITARKQAEHEIRRAAYHDGLTGAANRALFQLRLDAAISAATATAGSVGVVMVDLDDFKDVNDSLGHDAGDALLRATVERLAKTCAATATVARFGGDEFGIVVPVGAGDPPFATLASACLAALRQPVEHDGKCFKGTASLGWALFPEHGRESVTLLKNADLALYAVKAAGRNDARPFDPGMRAEATRRLTVLRMAGDALVRDAVVPFYQPKVSLTDNEVVGFEALLRWTDERGLRSPGEIAEAFDDPDLAMRIGARMLDRVAADMRGWREAGIPFGHVALNVGAREFRCDEGGLDLPRRLAAALDRHRLPASCLHVEITERVLLDIDADTVAPALRSLREAGIRIALDDFGTGYASLTHLQKYPVSSLKIDRSFVAQMEADPNAFAIVQALVGLARSLSITAVAEGAETVAQIELLRQIGCGVVQGFVFGRPMASSRVRHFLDTFGKGHNGAAPALPVSRRA